MTTKPDSKKLHLDIALDWWAIVGATFSALGWVATLCWIFPSGGRWSSIPAYFDPWHPFVVAMALLGIGGVLSFVAATRGKAEGRAWLIASVLMTVASTGLTILFVVVLPIVIWVIKVLLWVLKALLSIAGVAAGLWVLARLFGVGSSATRASRRTSRHRKCKGVRGYTLRDRWGRVEYVGITNDPRRRASEHRRSGKRGRFRIETRPLSRGDARHWERERLAWHRKITGGRNPRYNKTRDGGYRHRTRRSR